MLRALASIMVGAAADTLQRPSSDSFEISYRAVLVAVVSQNSFVLVFSSGASGGSLHGGASFKVGKAHFAA